LPGRSPVPFPHVDCRSPLDLQPTRDIDIRDSLESRRKVPKDHYLWLHPRLDMNEIVTGERTTIPSQPS
jgi:hypothetical protein